jgi:hypothetical protein
MPAENKTLWCILGGKESQSPFKILISSDKDIDDLRNLLYERTKNVTFFAQDLALWKVRYF